MTSLHKSNTLSDQYIKVEGHLGLNCNWQKILMSSVTWFGSHIVCNINLYSANIIIFETAEQIEVKLCRYDRLSMRNKRFSNYDVMGHMVWQPYCIE